MDDHVYEVHAALEDRHWWFEGRRRIVYPLIDDLVARRPGMVVDIGCGTGGTIAPLGGKYQVLGIDAAQGAIDIARRKYPGVEFRVGLAPDAIADVMEHASVLTMMDVLEHIEDDAAALARIVEAMRPGSFMLITVPAGMELWSGHDEVAHHLRRYDRDGLRRCWQGLPVREIVLTPYNTLLYPAIWAVRQVTRRLKSDGGAPRTDFHLPSPPVNALLAALFGAEGGRIRAVARGERAATGYPFGVSLLAVIERI
ncbi:MAG TPA: class I SAM-dependent methyltransferase [Candidatus Omnitrophota bacterium]|nr:class I SAM-dependent methyltransferase [Candidatus Omnitrophota bacterium]